MEEPNAKEIKANWNFIKLTFKVILLISFLIMAFSLINGIIRVSGDNSKTFVWNNDNMFNATSSYNFESGYPSDTINVREVGEYGGNYNATYSFDNETDGTSGTSIDFVDDYSGSANTSATIISNLGGHRKVLELYDNDGGDKCLIHNTWESTKTTGTIEFFMRSSDATRENTIICTNLGGASYGIFFQMKDDKFKYYDGAWNDVGLAASDNTWYHIKLIFDCTPDTYEIWIDNIQYQSAAGFNTASNGMINIRFSTSTPSSGYYFYIDAVGYSWDTDYNIGDNIVPQLEDSDFTYESDKWTFRYNGNDITDLLDDGTDNPNGWTDIDPTQDYVNINHDAPYYSDGYVNITSYAPLTSDRGIYREFDYEKGILNITWTTNMTDIGGAGNEFYTKIYSYDDTLLTKIFFEYGATGHYLKYDDGSEHTLYSTLSEGDEYIINVYINDGVACLSLYTNGVYNATHFFSLANNKDGLGKVEFEITGSASNDQEIHLDDIGVYINGTSITSELGILKTLMLTENEPEPYYWYFKEFNLFSFNVTGNSSVYLTEIGYLEEISTIEGLAPYNYYNESLEHINVYDFTFDGLNYIEPCQLWFVFNNQLNFNSASIDGVKLSEGINEYIPTFDYENVDPNESYFYCENNRLYFEFQPEYPADYEEYINLTIDINDFQSDNYTLDFSGGRYNNSDCQMWIEWYDWSEMRFELTESFRGYSFSIPDGRTINKFSFWCFSYYENQSGLTTGYFSSFTFSDTSLSPITIITLSFLNMLIPLIVMFAPTLGVYARWGKRTIIPMLLLMSIVCLATGLIPLWLFFIVILCLGSFIIIERKMEAI